MRTLYGLSAAAVVALLGSGYAGAHTPVEITYVPKSLAETSIVNGPWTLHQSVGRNRHDASGIVPSIDALQSSHRGLWHALRELLPKWPAADC